MGCTQPAVSQMVAKGVVKVRKDGKIHLLQAVKDWKAHVTPATTFGKGKNGTGQGGEKDSHRFYKARADREEAVAALAKLELAEKEETLVNADILRKKWAEVLVVLRNEVLAIGRQVAPSLVGLTDENIIADKIYQAGEIVLFSVSENGA